MRHRRIGSAGLAVALAHETGHHLGGAPYLKFCRLLSSEERATEWAMTVGLKTVFGRRAGPIGDRGSRQLEAVGIGRTVDPVARAASFPCKTWNGGTMGLSPGKTRQRRRRVTSHAAPGILRRRQLSGRIGRQATDIEMAETATRYVFKACQLSTSSRTSPLTIGDGGGRQAPRTT